MRTRFLNIDYFNSTSETLEFLRLPLPELPPSNFQDFHCFNEVYVLSLSLEIERSPIGDALSKFFSDVLPHTINVDVGDFANEHCSRKACFDEPRLFSSQNSTEIRTSEKENEITFDARDENRFEVVQFETPELDVFVENACFSEKEDMQIFFEVLEAENIPDMLNPEFTVQYPFEIQQSVYSIDDITQKYHIEQKACFSEEDGSFGDQFHLCHHIFPLLEVDEISLGISSSISREDEFLLLLENMEPKDWTQVDEVAVDCRELLVSVNIDILDYFLSKQCLESELAFSEVFLKTDVPCIIELSLGEENYAFHPGTREESVNIFLFEDLQFVDLDSSEFFNIFPNSQLVKEPEMCEQVFSEEMNIRNFDDLIVSHELALADEMFKSLPVPILSDHEKISSLYAFVEEMLSDLKPQSLSASDDIYLDWHLLESDNCNCNIYSSCRNVFEEINTYSIDSDKKCIDDGMLILDFVFSGDTPNGRNIEENKEILTTTFAGISVVHGRRNRIALSKLQNDGCQETGNREVLTDINAEKMSSIVDPMPQFNDLDFFINLHKATTGKNSKPADKASDIKATFPTVSSGVPVAACATSIGQLQLWDIKLHRIKLSHDFLGLIDNFQNIYLAILKNETELAVTQYLAVDNLKLLSLPYEKLMNCMKKTSTQGTLLSHGSDNGMAFVTLCAIKRMAWYLCYYGIHTTHIYANNLCRGLESIKFRLSSLQSLIEDEHVKANKDITKSHPSLSVIQQILQSNINQSSLKVLIVAENFFWWPLKRLLTSMKLSFIELQNFHMNTSQLDVNHSNEVTDATMDAMLHADCSFISHEYVSASLPFDKFGIILEYGGSRDSSRVSTVSPKLVGFPHLHFLKVELENSSVPKALCEGADIPRNFGFTMKGDPHYTTLNESNQKLEELLNFVPVEIKYDMGSLDAAYKVEACCMPLPVPCAPLSLESKQICTSVHSFPETIIIVNTQNFEKEMIISRRSTYQRILAMEKEGSQVLERELNLPVDVIISAAVCLAWFDCRNIGKKATAPNEASSCLPLCVENIAANVLTSLSFTFSGCILVFEGESSFLSAILESSDELYAAAASLGIDLQLFCSYSSELTDEIILSCIGYATKLTKGVYPKMSESETLAESFLTTFPSINPLSAHAILSSGGMLVEFLEWSHENRISSIRKYHVPDESVTLLSAVCRYGEREDSKSGTTDCSSVSSVPDFEICQSDTARKKHKHIGSLHKIGVSMDDLFNFDSLKQNDSWMSEGPVIFDETEKPSVSFNDDLFGQKTVSGLSMMMSPSRSCKPNDYRMSRGPEDSDEIRKSNFPLNDKFLGQKQGMDRVLINKLDQRCKNNSKNMREDFIGEVIDIDDSSLIPQDFSSIADSKGFSPLVHEIDKDPAVGNSATARRLSFSSSCLPTFPTAAEISSDSDVWISVEDHGESAKEGTYQHSNRDFYNNYLPSRHKMLFEEDRRHKTAPNFQSSFQEKDTPQYGGTPISNATRLAQAQQGSPWMVELVNRIKEKSRLRQQSLPCDMSPPCFGYSRNVSKVTKRKSPSILDFYRYRGGSTPKKILDHKRQKRSVQPSKNEKSSVSLPPTLTPLDKRARRTLSFATNGGGGQSKLIWSEKNAHTVNRRF
ncbi:protein SHORTAGE IN CHIASMATA 1 isoform X2 [Cornus florida]|uniref:protein SHORTAGE IN CHIASMATA 1 isoform X2 n=1 Tax=Cornus florida TaxID=4283 RepID=UPI00289D1BE4|nr:protein SHORTAGE IN CHIASMATA 1 isoform X2 [Cornus florida]